jgi:dipeptidyl aminopeptidase/acylaminoacyl peptidase
VDYVIEAGWVDPERICIAGWSYGGYSALISIVRRPERYRCAATWAAPTDLPLIFETSDGAATEWGREAWVKILGDPETQYDEMIEVSPAYRADEMQVPILLGHGTEDRRVDIEHLYRMRAMLDAHGKQYETYVIDGVGHSPSVEVFGEFVARLRSFVLESVGE